VRSYERNENSKVSEFELGNYMIPCYIIIYFIWIEFSYKIIITLYNEVANLIDVL